MHIFRSFTDKLLPAGQGELSLNRSGVGKLQGWVSTVVNAFLFAVKFGIGLIVGSVSLIADAIHTLSDVVSSAVVIWGFRQTEKPADKEHPFGHGRAEYIATLIIAILLCVVGIEFIRSSAVRIAHPQPIHPSWWMILAIAATIVLKEIIARYALFLSDLISSGTLHADAWHHRSDALSSLLVVTAMIGGRYGYHQIDGWAGLGVALFIIWTGVEIARDAIDDLIGKPPTEEDIEKIRQTAESVPGVLGAHDISIHSYGKDKYASVHIELDARETSANSHDIAEEVEQRLMNRLNIDPTVHIDPIHPEHPKIQEITTFLEKNWGQHEVVKEFHDIRVVDTAQHHVIIFGISVLPDLSKREIARCCSELETSIRSNFPGFDVKIKVSHLHQY